MKYAFIDYENINSLDGLALQRYEKIYVFLGAAISQEKIHFSDKYNDEISLTFIRAEMIGNNNLDFHLAYFLGKLDDRLDKRIEFEVISNDRGYTGICHYISHQLNPRKCVLTHYDLVNKTLIYPDEKPKETVIIEPKPAYHIWFDNIKQKWQRFFQRKPKGTENSVVDTEKELAETVLVARYSKMLTTNKKIRPKKLSSLRNDIKMRLHLTSDQEIETIISLLEHTEYLKVKSDLQIIYLK